MFFFVLFFLWFGLTQNLLSSLGINEHLELCSRAHGEHDCENYASMEKYCSCIKIENRAAQDQVQ